MIMRVGVRAAQNELVIYLLGQTPEQAALLEKLGKRRMGKSCLYVKKLGNIDLEFLQELTEKSVVAVQAKYPSS